MPACALSACRRGLSRHRISAVSISPPSSEKLLVDGVTRPSRPSRTGSAQSSASVNKIRRRLVRLPAVRAYAKTAEIVAAIIAEKAVSRPQRVWDEANIADVIILPVINEARRILEEGVAFSAADIDLVKIHGQGFPRWRGGLMQMHERSALRRPHLC